MSFLSGALRVAGFITAPVCIASGVGIPLGLAIGAASTAATSAAANEIDRAREKAELDRQAAEQKQRANEKLEAEKQAEKRRREQVENELRLQQEQAELPGKALEACGRGDTAALPSILKRLTNQQFDQLSLNLLAACPDADAKAKVQQIIAAENSRRFS